MGLAADDLGVCRFADDQDDSLPFHGTFAAEPDFRRTVVVRHHRDGRCTVDRGTQTYGGLTADAKVFAAGQALQARLGPLCRFSRATLLYQHGHLAPLPKGTGRWRDGVRSSHP